MSTTTMTLGIVSVSLAALAASAAPAEKRTLLLAGSDENHTARGLSALGVPFERRSPADFARLSPFRYDLIIWGMDEPRGALSADPEQVAAFLDAGGVMLGFRGADEDPWVPVPARRDKAYQFGAILQPGHAVFATPNRLTEADLRAVHGGSIYRAFHALGPGWVPLVSTGATQDWDKTPESAPGQPHAGIIELPVGAGRLIMVQMIPEYHWFNDCKGDAASAGARLFANLVQYALTSASAQAATRPEPDRPESFVDDLSALVPLPCGFAPNRPEARDWNVRCQGPYKAGADRRGVWTVTHADVPSAAGSFCELSRHFPLPADGAATMLRWYVSDTYCGGLERVLGGADHGKAAFANERRGYRFAQVLVNGRLVWEQDVLGRNPQPASRRFYSADIADALKAAPGACTVTLRVEDRVASGDRPFAIDVFWGAVDLLDGLVRIPAAAVGGTPTVILQPGQTATWPPARRAGQVRVAVRLQDRVQDRPELVLLLGGNEVQRWPLTADDQSWHWAVSAPADVKSGTPIALRLDGPAAALCPLAELALVPVTEATPAGPGQPPSAGPAGAAETRAPDRFDLRVAETAGVARLDAVATQGLPFPAGVLREVTAIRLADGRGTPVPCQAAPLATWPDGSIKVAVVSFPVSVDAGAAATYHASLGEAAAPSVPRPLSVTEQGDEITIDTGAIVATVSRTQGRLVESVRRADGRELKSPAQVWDLVLEDESGRVVRSGGPTVATVDYADRGPLRLLLVRCGSFADSAGKLVDYRLQLEATAGADALRLESIIVNRETTPEVYLRRWSMEFAGLDLERGRVWLADDRAVPVSPGALLYQHREDRLSWTGDDGRAEWAEGRSPGFVRAGGIGLGARWFWQRFPHCLRFEPSGLRYDLITPALNERDLPVRWQQRMAEVTDRYRVGGVGYPQSPGKMGLFRLAPGEALHEELLMVFDGAPADADLRPAMAGLTDRLRAAPDPAYTAATRVFGEFHPADRLFDRYEESVEAAYRSVMAKRQTRREYGFENYGDDTFEWGYGPSYTYWSNSEYDHHHAFLLQFVRSGDPRWWELGEQQSRHYRDITVVHSGAPDVKGGPRHHNATSLWMPQHKEQYWIADHTAAGASCGHSWAEGMVDYWYLTGDPWSGQVVRDMADWYCNRIENNGFGAGGQERGPGWALIAVSALASALQTERLAQAANTVASWLITWQDPMRGVISVPISEQPSYEGGSVFMHGIVGRGLGRWADVCGDPRVRLACIGIAEWMTTEPMGAKGTFWYKQSPENSRNYGPTDQCLSALTYAHRFSGDPWFGEVALALFRQTGAGSRSMSWYPQALAHLAPVITPAEVVLETEAVTVAPDTPRPLGLRVRNTSDEPVRVTVRPDVPAPFQIEAPAPVSVAPAEERLIAVPLGTRLAEGSARVPVAVVVSDPSGTAKTTVVTVTAEAMDRIVEIGLAPQQARVTPPMVLETLAGRPCLHTPRTPQTVPKPRPQDTPEGGSAEFDLELPVAGRYAILADVYWLDEEGNSLFLGIDAGPDRAFGNAGAKNRWIRIEAGGADLAAGRHTLRVRTREDGARLGGLSVERRPTP